MVLLKDHGADLVVSVHTFFSDDLRSNPAVGSQLTFFYVNVLFEKTKVI